MLNEMKPKIDSLNVGESCVYYTGQTGGFLRFLSPEDTHALLTYFDKLQRSRRYEFKQRLRERNDNIGTFDYIVKRLV